MKVIGGEYDIDFRALNSNRRFELGEHEFAYASGRSALFYILRSAIKEKQITTVMIPDYICESVLLPIRKLGLECVIYPLNVDWTVNRQMFTELYRKHTAVLLVNYFGLMALESDKLFLRSLDEEVVIIEDDVQAYFEYTKDLGVEDYKFTSLRKTFVVPDGGLVKTRRVMNLPKKANSFAQYKVAGSLLKHEREKFISDDSIYLQLMESGEDKIDEALEDGMSDVSGLLMSTENSESIAEQRKINYKILEDGVRELANTPPACYLRTDCATPLFMPIMIENRDAVRRYLFEKMIFCPVHWPVENDCFKMGYQMYKNELSLIVDQRYNEDDMFRLLNVLEDAIKKNR